MGELLSRLNEEFSPFLICLKTLLCPNFEVGVGSRNVGRSDFSAAHLKARRWVSEITNQFFGERHMTTKPFRLTKAEKTILSRLTDQHGNHAASKRAAKHVNNNRFSEHRGAYPIKKKGERLTTECVIFGNDGFGDVRIKKEIAALVARLAEFEIPIRGFGVEPDGYSWAMQVECDDDVFLDLLVWHTWFSITCPNGNPVTEEFNEYLDELGYDMAA